MRRRGYALIVEVVIALSQAPRSTKELARDLGRDFAVPHVLAKLLRRLWDLRVLYVTEWRTIPPRMVYERIMAVGDLPDAPPPRRYVSHNHPSMFDGLPRGKGGTSSETRKFAAFWHALARPVSRAALLACGCGHCTTTQVLRTLKAARLVHTAAWEARQRAGLPTELFQRGDGPDVPRPERRSNRVYAVRFRERRRALRRQEQQRAAYVANSSIFNLAGAA